MIDKEQIEVHGQKIDIPPYVKNKKTFKEYWERKITYDKDPSRNLIINDTHIRLPHPALTKILAKSDLTVGQKKSFVELNKSLLKEQGNLSALLRKAGSESGKSYSSESIIDQHGTKIIELLGQWHTPYDVYKKLPSLGIKGISYERIMHYSTKNATKIRELRNKGREDYDDISLGLKRSRLEKLNYLLNNTLQEYESSYGPKKLEYSKEIRAILDQARKEVEGDELKLTIDGKIDIEATILQSSTMQSELRGLTITQLVLSRVASRLGLPSQYLIDRLAHSFYAKHNGFRRIEDLQTKPLYPSSINYDILDLQDKYSDWKAKQSKFIEDAVIIEKEQVLPPARVKSTKDLLRDQLKNLK